MAPPERRRSARELYRQLDGPDDDSFRRSLAGRMRGLGERMARRIAADPSSAARERRAALADYDNVRRRRFRRILAGGIAALVVAEVAYFEFVATSDEEPSTGQVAETVALPASSAPPRPPPVIVKANVPVEPPPPLETPPVQRPLTRDDVREVQRRLHGFGFNAGPVDGVAGRMTQGAVMHYRQSRGLPQSGTVDRALLERLRHDGAPQSAPPQAARRSAPPSPPPRSTDPFEPVRMEFERFERWVQSFGR